jgi:hypothetical protein
MTDRNGSVRLIDEWPLSGIGIQWQLSGDQSEERTVSRRPRPCKNDKFQRPVEKINRFDSSLYVNVENLTTRANEITNQVGQILNFVFYFFVFTQPGPATADGSDIF